MRCYFIAVALQGALQIAIIVIMTRLRMGVYLSPSTAPLAVAGHLMQPKPAGPIRTVRAISGFLPVDDAEIRKGAICFEGQSVLGLPPYDVARRGVVLVPERRKIFETLTVEENMRIAPHGGGAGTVSTDIGGLFEIFPALAQRRKQIAGYLSGGERQMLAIAQVLLCGPKLRIVDELSLGLAPLLVKELMTRLVELRAKFNLSILLIEQDARSTLAVADYGYVLEGGCVVYEGTADKLRSHGDVQEFYLGSGESARMNYCDVKQYRRSRRWWG